MSNKLTNKDLLILELNKLKINIETKIKKLYTLRKLPHRRIAKGVELLKLVEKTILHTDKFEKSEAQECLMELKEQGIMVTNTWNDFFF